MAMIYNDAMVVVMWWWWRWCDDSGGGAAVDGSAGDGEGNIDNDDDNVNDKR